MNWTIGNILVLGGAVVALVTGVVNKDPMTAGTACLTIAGVFVHPPTSPAARS